jgi:NAD(P)-dependent dehydrogenase (short-subunit alcohol dehydrogenase family)
MDRTYVVTGAASGIGAATARRLKEAGAKVIASDLHDADVVADLATSEGRAALVEGVLRLSGGRLDGIVANAGGGPAETSLQLNFFGAVATLDGLRPLLAERPAPRAVAVSSIASLRPMRGGLLQACLAMDEPAAVKAALKAFGAGELGAAPGNPPPDAVQAGLDLYGSAKQALQVWCRRAAPRPEWAGSGILLNVAALGFYETPAAAYVLEDPASRAGLSPAGRTRPPRSSPSWSARRTRR